MLDVLVDNMIHSMGIGYYILVYGIGLLAMTFSVIAFQFKKRVTIILSNFLGQTCWVLYFLNVRLTDRLASTEISTKGRTNIT